MATQTAQPIGAPRSRRADYTLIVVVITLMVIGLVIMYSISPIQTQRLFGNTSKNYYFYNQLQSTFVGIVFWWIASRIHYQTWKKWAPIILGFGILASLLLLVPSLNVAKNGATRWLKIGPLNLQPAELLKLGFTLYLADWFARRKSLLSRFNDSVWPLVTMLAGLSILVVILQRDMGTMMVMVLASIGMAIIGGLSFVNLAGFLGILVAGSVAAIVTFPHRIARLLTFLDPSKDASGLGYQINQALIAVGTGGLFGLGLGKSIQIYGYLPEATNDSIFAIIAEEFGLFGCLAILALYGALVYRGLKIARGAPDDFGRLAAVGITLWLAFQAMINIAAMISLVPLTGIPLPFISFGGSSLVFALVGVGILVNISKYSKVEEVKHADRRVRGRNSGSYLANSSNR